MNNNTTNSISLGKRINHFYDQYLLVENIIIKYNVKFAVLFHFRRDYKTLKYVTLNNM